MELLQKCVAGVRGPMFCGVFWRAATDSSNVDYACTFASQPSWFHMIRRNAQGEV